MPDGRPLELEVGVVAAAVGVVAVGVVVAAVVAGVLELDAIDLTRSNRTVRLLP
jgi:hypothetical protein